MVFKAIKKGKEYIKRNAENVERITKNAADNSEKLAPLIAKFEDRLDRADRILKNGKYVALGAGAVGVSGLSTGGAAGYTIGKKKGASADSWEEAAKSVSAKSKGGK